MLTSQLRPPGPPPRCATQQRRDNVQKQQRRRWIQVQDALAQCHAAELRRHRAHSDLHRRGARAGARAHLAGPARLYPLLGAAGRLARVLEDHGAVCLRVPACHGPTLAGHHGARHARGQCLHQGHGFAHLVPPPPPGFPLLFLICLLVSS